SRKWYNLSEKIFLKKIFVNALIIRWVYVVFSYFFYTWMTGQPFEFGAADSMFYHGSGEWIANVGLFNWYAINAESGLQISDMGHPVFIGLVYSVFGKFPIIVRLLGGVFSAWMCVLLYKLAKRNFGEVPAKNTAIIALLMPQFIYYCGLHLKETYMIFMAVLFLERADAVIRSEKIQIKNLIVPILIGALLFLYRTVLGASVWFAFLSALLFTKGKKSSLGRRIVLALWFILAALFVFSGKIERELDAMWKVKEQTQRTNMEWRSVRKDGNAFSKYGSAVLFAPAILIVPFPTMLNVHTQQNQMYQHGSYLIKNILSFFVLVALFVLLIKYKSYRHHVLLLLFLIAYLATLTMSSFALSERFHLPILPVLTILVGFGMTQVTNRLKDMYVPYLVFVALVVIAWNIFKLAGRGVI
ncbi:MAG: glycosyltransferase family 39 protein, partial [Paludibacteraceae bacterium]|nr:glycosyltransferase family 39 protein [Paludibacteraceae bacterium]